MSATVALIKGAKRWQNASQALAAVADQISLADRRLVLVKPNLVSPTNQLASTHVDAVAAVLAFVRERYDGRLLVAEGAAISPTGDGFDRFGYRPLVRAYDVELVDLNAAEAVPVIVRDRRLRPQTVHLARPVLESDFRVSVGPPKTHDTVLVTLSLKNLIMGALINQAVASRPGRGQVAQAARRLQSRLSLGVRNDKVAMHQGYAAMNLNLALLAPLVMPHLAVIDGFEAMEGAGPMSGDPVPWRVALAGTDALAVDWLTAHLMGFDPQEIGYLAYARRLGLGVADLGSIRVVGNATPAEVRRRFRPHPTSARQRRWQLPDVDRWLAPAAAPQEDAA